MAENTNSIPLTKFYYGIGEVAELLQVNASLIRYWEKEFRSLRPKKGGNGNRLYTVKDIEKLRYIHFLVKVQGHTLEGARKLLKQREKEDKGEFAIVQTLEQLKVFLIKLRNEL